MSMMKYRVIREHGAFAEGDIREAEESSVAHLVGKSLTLIGPADNASVKSEPAPKNKALSAAPANKSATGKKTRSKT
ncbi:hypothetical protein LB519_14755 [Mesorhizobium sp. AD1-1]|uniref:hypothetical protein n=1 Tax=Mesorhizobium sp. AD1-1 TaxID=2876621 RepID=UPI001CCA1DC7|nr:hypothetical protein [Mesorhizobium sp. AD1-1]MBZ9719106.1 hypothetical protein [Mesorhizobium sp. AD1-1]